jgi:MFS family permease
MTKELFQVLVSITFIPLIIAFLIVTFGITDVKNLHIRKNMKFHSMNRRYWKFLLVCIVFTLANSSDAFLILRAQELGMNLSSIFFLLAFYCLISVFVGLPIASLSDKIGRKWLLMTGWIVYGIVYIGFSSVHSLLPLMLLFVGYGCYLGFTEGVMKAWVADVADKDQRATAFGIYNMVIGITFLFASLLTGLLWQYIGLSGALLVDAFLAFIAVVLLFFLD